MHTATLVLLILAAGLGSQWVAWRLGLPAIVILIASGLVLGPITSVIELGLSQENLAELIGLGVAIILFEGGMNLKLGEFRRVGHGISRLTLIGPPLAMILGAVAAHYVAGLSWPVAIVLGAILVVTGPTVITPLLRQARLNKQSASLLKWEGIVNDPTGALLAVLAFQYFTLAGGDWSEIVAGLGIAILAALVLGGLGGWLTGWMYRRGNVPAHLKPPMLMVLVLGAYWTSNLLQHEAGLLTVTVMGLVIGNMDLAERKPLRHFKENLTIVLVSVLFIVIPTQLSVDQLALIDIRALLFVLVLLLLVRPLTIALATIGSPIKSKDRILLGWIAPRGIVAAATAGLFGPGMAAAGYPDAEALLPLVFLIILVTVILHGMTLGPLARRLKLAADAENGLLIVGANAWTRALAEILRSLDINVLVADGNYQQLKPLRMDGTRVYYGELLSEHAEHELEDEHLSYLLAATSNDYYNALVCKAQDGEFGQHRTFQLVPSSEAAEEQRRLAVNQRGYYAFKPNIDLPELMSRLDQGWSLQHTRLDAEYDLEKLESTLGEPGSDWILVATVSPSGKFRLEATENSKDFEENWRLIYFARHQINP